jgi:very-short-patch-repair endonuclease
MPKSNGLITNFREIPYNPSLKDYAREMRNNSTKGEIKFWCELLRKKKSGYQFYRQKIINHYIVDFYCAKLKLVVEIDGTSHDDKTEYDKNREDLLNSLGLKVIHYDDVKVLNNFHLIEEDFIKQLNIRVKELSITK